MDVLPLIEQCAASVAPSVMQRIVRAESAFRPHVIGYHVTKDGKAFRLPTQPRDQAEAVSWATWLLANGYRFDAGIAQINSRNFARLGLTPATVFDPCTNLAAGGRIFNEFYGEASQRFGSGQRAMLAAISAYQSGSFTRGFETGYVQRVMGLPGDFPGLAKGQGRAVAFVAQKPANPFTADTSVSFQ